MRIIFKTLIFIVIILALIALAIFIFIKTSSQFGAFPDGDSKKIIQNSKNFINGKFVNLNPVPVNTNDASTRPNEKRATLMDWISPAKDKNP